MKNITLPKIFFNFRYAGLFLAFLFVLSMGCRKFLDNKLVRVDLSQVNLVSNDPNWNPAHLDPSLVNAWGLTWSPGGIAWVNSEAGHVSELYSGEGVAIRPGVNIPSPKDSVGG